MIRPGRALVSESLSTLRLMASVSQKSILGCLLFVNWSRAVSGDEEHMLIWSPNPTMQGEINMLKGRAAIHRDLDGLKNKADKNFIKFNMDKQEQSQAIQGSDYFPLLKAC